MPTVIKDDVRDHRQVRENRFGSGWVNRSENDRRDDMSADLSVCPTGAQSTSARHAETGQAMGGELGVLTRILSQKICHTADGTRGEGQFAQLVPNLALKTSLKAGYQGGGNIAKSLKYWSRDEIRQGMGIPALGVPRKVFRPTSRELMTGQGHDVAGLGPIQPRRA
jgi:hypothetical protein